MRVVLIVLVLVLVLPLHSWVVYTNLVHYRVSHASHSRVPENVASYAHPHDGGVKEGCSNLEQRVVDCPSGGMPHYPCRRSPQDRPPRRGKGLRVEPLVAHGLVKGKLELGPAVVDGGAGKEHRGWRGPGAALEVLGAGLGDAVNLGLREAHLGLAREPDHVGGDKIGPHLHVQARQRRPALQGG